MQNTAFEPKLTSKQLNFVERRHVFVNVFMLFQILDFAKILKISEFELKYTAKLNFVERRHIFVNVFVLFQFLDFAKILKISEFELKYTAKA